jgi:hypothetical protein
MRGSGRIPNAADGDCYGHILVTDGPMVPIP